MDAVPLRDALSGACGAACLVVCGAPFDTVKLRVQARLADSPVAAARAILAHEGAPALWRGAGPAFASAVVENAVLFSSQGLLRRLADSLRAPGSGAPHPAEHVALGAVSGVMSATAICPAEVVKVRMQAQRGGAAGGGVGGGVGAAPTAPAPLAAAAAAPCAPPPRFPSGWHCAAHILRVEGAGALFTGLRPLLLRDVPFNAVFMGAYRNIVQAYRGARGLPADAALPTHVTLLAGGAAGSAAWAVVFPADVLKSRAQVACGGGGGGGAPPPRPSLVAAARAVVAADGVRGLYRGCSAAIARSIPANAALFWGVETSERLLKRAGL